MQLCQGWRYPDDSVHALRKLQGRDVPRVGKVCRRLSEQNLILPAEVEAVDDGDEEWKPLRVDGMGALEDQILLLKTAGTDLQLHRKGDESGLKQNWLEHDGSELDCERLG